jgi:hypothetical protein
LEDPSASDQGTASSAQQNDTVPLAYEATRCDGYHKQPNNKLILLYHELQQVPNLHRRRIRGSVGLHRRFPPSVAESAIAFRLKELGASAYFPEADVERSHLP